MKSDLHIQQGVQAELRSEPSIDAARIGVAVIEGIGMLAGPLASDAAKWAAEHMARRNAGVRASLILLAWRLADGKRREDADTARSVWQACARGAQGFCQLPDHVLVSS